MAGRARSVGEILEFTLAGFLLQFSGANLEQFLECLRHAAKLAENRHFKEAGIDRLGQI